MRYLSKDYVQSEILNTISLMQLNKETVPIIDNVIIEEMADAFIFSWNEVGDYEANFDQCLLEHLRAEFKYNYK